MANNEAYGERTSSKSFCENEVEVAFERGLVTGVEYEKQKTPSSAYPCSVSLIMKKKDGRNLSSPLDKGEVGLVAFSNPPRINLRRAAPSRMSSGSLGPAGGVVDVD